MDQFFALHAYVVESCELTSLVSVRRCGAAVASLLMVGFFVAGAGAHGQSPGFRLGVYQGRTSPVLFLQGDKLVKLSSVVGFTLREAPLSACGGPASSKTTVVCLSGRAVGATWATHAAGGSPVCAPTSSLGTLAPVQALGWSPALRMPANGVLNVNQTVPHGEIIKAHLNGEQVCPHRITRTDRLHPGAHHRKQRGSHLLDGNHNVPCSVAGPVTLTPSAHYLGIID